MASKESPEASSKSDVTSDVRTSRICFTHKIADDLPPLKPLKFSHITPKLAGPVHKAKAYANGMVCDQKMAIEQLRYIRRNLEREDRELRKIQAEVDMYRSSRKWSPIY